MKLIAAAALWVAVAAAAATTTTSAATAGPSCAASNILSACLDTENAQLSSCGDNDWNCKCAAYGNIITCYNNCPNDPELNSAQGQEKIFCGYASQYQSTTTKAKATATGSGKTTAAAASDTAAAGSGTATATGSVSSSSTAKADSGAADLALNAGSVLVAIAGVMAAML